MGERGKIRVRIHTNCEDDESIKVEKFEWFWENLRCNHKNQIGFWIRDLCFSKFKFIKRLKWVYLDLFGFFFFFFFFGIWVYLFLSGGYLDLLSYDDYDYDYDYDYLFIFLHSFS